MKVKMFWVAIILLSVLAISLFAEKSFKDYRGKDYRKIAHTPEELMKVIIEERGKGTKDTIGSYWLEGLKNFAVEYDFTEREKAKKPTEYVAFKDKELENELKSMVMSKLKKAGIETDSGDEWGKTPTRPILQVSIRIQKPDYSSSYSYDTEYTITALARLYDQISLVRKPDRTVYRYIWEGGEEESNKKNVCEELINKTLDNFISVYLASNPKEQVDK